MSTSFRTCLILSEPVKPVVMSFHQNALCYTEGRQVLIMHFLFSVDLIKNTSSYFKNKMFTVYFYEALLLCCFLFHIVVWIFFVFSQIWI